MNRNKSAELNTRTANYKRAQSLFETGDAAYLFQVVHANRRFCHLFPFCARHRSNGIQIKYSHFYILKGYTSVHGHTEFSLFVGLESVVSKVSVPVDNFDLFVAQAKSQHCLEVWVARRSDRHFALSNQVQCRRGLLPFSEEHMASIELSLFNSSSKQV